MLNQSEPFTDDNWSVSPIVSRCDPFADFVEDLDDRVHALGEGNEAALKLLLDQHPVENYDLLSLDVFDTLLLRDDIPEAVRFQEIGEHWLQLSAQEGHTAADAFLARSLAAEIAYRTRPHIGGCREGHINDIITMACRQLGIPHDEINTCKIIELEYESQHVFANGLLVDYAKMFVEAGKPVVLVSDMYLDAASIRFLLSKAGKELEIFQLLYSSADEVVSKRSGLLFDLVLERIGIDAARALHIGDALVGDVRQPALRGWRSQHFPVSSREREKRLERLGQFKASMADEGVDVTRSAKV